jgi:hypothetical protein
MVAGAIAIFSHKTAFSFVQEAAFRFHVEFYVSQYGGGQIHLRSVVCKVEFRPSSARSLRYQAQNFDVKRCYVVSATASVQYSIESSLARYTIIHGPWWIHSIFNTCTVCTY